jgi:hypothetical protein
MKILLLVTFTVISIALSPRAAQAQNTVYGTGALQNNTTGDANTAIGLDALFQNTAGSANTAIGGFALQSNITGNNYPRWRPAHSDLHRRNKWSGQEQR